MPETQDQQQPQTREPNISAPWWSPHDLTPGYFAIVIASGIISLACKLLNFTVASTVLLIIAAVAYILLVVLNIWRFIAYRSALIADFTNVRQSFGFFTFVAGTGVLGTGLAMAGWWTVASILLVIAAVAWLILGYVIPVVAVLGKTERPITQGANGLWFVLIVGAQSVAVLAATLEPVLDNVRNVLAITAVFAWSLGLVLYVAVAVFVALRLMTFRLDPREFNPPYWVSMGAVAITVLAAARIAEMSSAPMVDATRGLVAGIAVLMWCFATWLIPPLFGVGIWRHGIHRVPLKYEPSLWSIVFPLGMYSVAGIYLGRVNDLPIVETVGSWWLVVAIAAWALTCIAMVRAIIRRILYRV